MTAIDKILTVDEMMRVARRRVPKMFFEYADSGSYTEGTYQQNESDFSKILLNQKVAVNLEGRNLKVKMLGKEITMPVAIAPAATGGMQTADGEIKAARAAEKFGIPDTLSTMRACSIEDVAQTTTATFRFQRHVKRDHDSINSQLNRD